MSQHGHAVGSDFVGGIAVRSNPVRTLVIRVTNRYLIGGIEGVSAIASSFKKYPCITEEMKTKGVAFALVQQYPTTEKLHASRWYNPFLRNDDYTSHDGHYLWSVAVRDSPKNFEQCRKSIGKLAPQAALTSINAEDLAKGFSHFDSNINKWASIPDPHAFNLNPVQFDPDLWGILSVYHMEPFYDSENMVLFERQLRADDADSHVEHWRGYEGLAQFIRKKDPRLYDLLIGK